MKLERKGETARRAGSTQTGLRAKVRSLGFVLRIMGTRRESLSGRGWRCGEAHDLKSVFKSNGPLHEG